MESPVRPKRVWASLITNLDYLPGLLTLHHSLHNPRPDSSTNFPASPTSPNDGIPDTTSNPAARGTRYPFVAFYTSSFPTEGLKVLQARGISTQWVPNVTPATTREYEQDPRFIETWTKLVAFSLTEYERVVLLDGDILVRRNMDELMEMELDAPEVLARGAGTKVFAAAHACACNPMKKPHYPDSWIPANCAYTSQHPVPSVAQTTAPAPSTGVGMLNSGVLVIVPSAHTYAEITIALQDTARISAYDFPDQELLTDVFRGRWVALPYVYNALKTLRWADVHSAIWRDDEVRAVHYIFARKPWHEEIKPEHELRAIKGLDEPGVWWWEANWERARGEREAGIVDKYSE
ncbi:Glycosyl transferase family 8 [Penicillium macrosclerotiorum]|uniref:Glycosyl transferase family 8 n=1 Tax=Penicillium macrosclerotiorum TaxID=303699 RepID=UPI002549837D|nr:Glycosyl transferase family 8 [Penicillium macrosclerotiorum]KAJ5692132.1 Glycosyl transferase family 8 [Penicillium macrosclerotiorum]